MPLLVLIALVFAAIGGTGDSAGDDPGGAITASAPPDAVAQTAPCTKLLEALPVSLKSLAPRVVDTTPSSPFVVAWGTPAIVLRCGVAKPRAFNRNTSQQVFAAGAANGANYWVDRAEGANVYTAIDRQAFVSITLPDTYQPADYVPVLDAAIVKAMPDPACVVTPTATTKTGQLCTRRS